MTTVYVVGVQDEDARHSLLSLEEQNQSSTCRYHHYQRSVWVLHAPTAGFVLTDTYSVCHVPANIN